MPAGKLRARARSAPGSPRSAVLVIGAGIGGLSAAVALAARGFPVDVLEAGPRAGGKLNIATIDGVEVDTGPSVLTLPDTLDRTLRLAGTTLREELTLREPAPAFRYLYPDGVALDVFAQPEQTLASVAATLGTAAAAELAGFLAYARTIWEAAAPRFVYGPAPSLASVVRAGADVRALLRIDPLRRMNAAIRQRVRSEHLRTLLARYATYNGSDPRHAPATLNCIAHVELSLGGYGVEGGMYQIVRALVRAAERLGVRFHYGAAVEHIHTAHGRVLGADTADGRHWKAGAVVANADAAHVLQDLVPGAPRSARRAAGAAPSMSGWVGVLRARRRAGPQRRIAHTVLFPDHYLQEFADVFDRRRSPTEPTVYLCAQEPCHGRRGWAAAEPVFLMANAPPVADSTAPGAYDALRETVLHRTRVAGLRDPLDPLVYERTPAELAVQFPGSRGSIYGAASNSPLAAFRRPPNRVRGVKGLYLASGSAHPGGGVPLCVLSGHAAARALLADHGAHLDLEEPV